MGRLLSFFRPRSVASIVAGFAKMRSQLAAHATAQAALAIVHEKEIEALTALRAAALAERDTASAIFDKIGALITK